MPLAIRSVKTVLLRWLRRLAVAVSGVVLGVVGLKVAIALDLVGLGYSAQFRDGRDVVHGPSALEVPDLGLTLDLSLFAKCSGALYDFDHMRGKWDADFFDGRVHIHLQKYPVDPEDTYRSPGHLMERKIRLGYDAIEGEHPAPFFDVWEPLPRPMGWVPHGWYGRRDIRRLGHTTRHEAFICGQVKDAGYMLRLEFDGPLSRDELAALDEWALDAVRYQGDVQSPQWSAEEVESYWIAHTPPSWAERRSEFRVERTKHYLIITDVAAEGTDPLLELLEDNYRTIQGVFAFDDLPSQRLMPVLYFEAARDFYSWYSLGSWAGMTAEWRARGACKEDAYATHNTAPDHSTHIHEQTHQIFKTRLQLTGGGSWFQEGLATYIAEPPARLSKAKTRVARGHAMPLEQLMMLPVLSRLPTLANIWDVYEHSAALVEFCKHSSYGRAGFSRWVHTMSQVTKGDLPGMRRAISQTYGASLQDFEHAFREYCAHESPIGEWRSPAMESENPR